MTTRTWDYLMSMSAVPPNPPPPQVPIAKPRALVTAADSYRVLPLFFFGTLLGLLGFVIYLSGIFFSVARLVLHLREPLRSRKKAIVWYSGLPCTLGLTLAATDLALLLPRKRMLSRREGLSPISDRQVVVVLTSYNDEKSIGDSVEDFRNQ